MKKFVIIVIILLLLLIFIPIKAQSEEISNIIEPFEEIIVTPSPTPEPTPVPLPREVHISSSVRNNRVEIGMSVTLTATLINFTEEDQCTFVWQYSEDGNSWKNIPDSNSVTYTFIVSEDNYKYYWRVSVYH